MAYTDLITRVISDFDSIFDVLVNKKLKFGTGDSAETITVAKHRDTGKIQTSDYATLLGSLVHVNGLSTNEVIANYGGVKGTAATSSLSIAQDGSYQATVTIPAAAYYDTGSTLKTTIATTGLTISESIANVTAADGLYTFTPATTSTALFDTVILKQGSVTVTTNKASVNESGVTYTTSITSGTISGVLASTDPDAYATGSGDDKKQNAYQLKFKTSVTRGGSLVITPTIGGSDGYLTPTEINELKNQEGATLGFADNDSTKLTSTFNLNAEQSIYIKKGGFELNSADTSGAVAQITGTGAVWGTKEEYEAKKAIKLEATVGNVDLTGKFTEGYVESANNISLGAITGLSGEAYLKIGSVGTPEVDASISLTGDTAIGITKAAAEALGTGKFYKITAAIPDAKKTQAKKLTAGMISSEDYNITLSSTAQDVYIAKGEVTINPKATVTLGSSNIVTTTTSDYAFTVTPSVMNTTEEPGISGFKAGYFATAPTLSPKTSNAVTYYVKPGSVTTTASFSAALTEVAGDGAGGKYETVDNKQVLEDIFETDLDSVKNRDYYTITATGISTVVDGYVEASKTVITNNTAVRYLPKADITRQVEYDTDKKTVLRTYLEVTKGGYLPSGTIAEIAADGTITDEVESISRVYAAVKATIDADYTSVISSGTDSKAIFSAEEIVGGYKLAVTKAAKTSAGYISGTTGEGTVSGDFWIAKGSTTATSEFTPDQSLKDSKPVLTAVEEGTGEKKTVIGYSLTVAGTHKTTVTTQEGYITATEVTLEDVEGEEITEGNVIETDVSQTVVFDKANIVAAQDTQQISLGIEVAEDIATVTKAEGEETNPSKYVITPKLDGESSIVVHSSVDGYLKSTDTFEIDILADGSKESATPIFIKEGEGGDIVIDTSVTIADTEKLKIRPDFSTLIEDEAGDYYKIEAKGKLAVKADMGEGYYGSPEIAKVKSNTAVDLGFVKVNKAEAAASISGSVGITSDDVHFVETAPANGEGTQYVTISAGATVTGSVSVTSAGYIKNGEATEAKNVADDKGVFPVTPDEVKIALFTDVGTAKAPKTVGQSTGALDEEVKPLVLETEHKYVQSNITVGLTPNAMGSSVIDYFTQLSNRLDGKLTRS